MIVVRSGRIRFVLAVIGAGLINLMLLGVASLLSKERSPKQDISDPVSISLINLDMPEPPEPEDAPPPEKPKAEPQTDFQPDLIQPDLAGPGDFTGGIAINLDGVGSGNLSGDFVFESYELDQTASPAVKTAPVYPFKAREQGIEGVVQVKILVNVDGTVAEVQIMDARPAGLFEEAVLKAVPMWRFKPGTIDGKAVKSWVVTAVRFELN